MRIKQGGLGLMKHIKFLTVLIATALFAACGESSFKGTSAPQKNTAERKDAKAESPKGTDEKQDTQKDKDADAKADTADKGKELGEQIDVGDATNGPTSPDSNSTSPTSNTIDAGGGDDGKWREDQVITDLVTLEECKMDILKRTGDASICMKCFQAFIANGNITAGACGCAWAKNPPAASPAPAPKP